MPTFSADDITAAVAEALAHRANGEGMSAREIAESLGYGERKTQAALLKLSQAGRLKPSRAYRTAIDGIQRPVSVYTIRPA